MSKTKEELMKFKEEIETINKKIEELSDAVLMQLTGVNLLNISHHY